MKLSEIYKDKLHDIPNDELVLLHYRLHQLYNGFKKKGKKDKVQLIIKLHTMLKGEMMRRGIKHKSEIAL